MVHSAYVLWSASSVIRHLDLEKMIYRWHFTGTEPLQEDTYVYYDLEFPDLRMYPPQSRKKRILLLAHRGIFNSLIFYGDMATPYVRALRRVAHAKTNIINNAQEDSQLMYFLLLSELPKQLASE